MKGRVTLNYTEAFRNELLTKLRQTIPQSQILEMLPVLDQTLSEYDVSRKPVEIITTDGIPEPVKNFLTSKAIGNCSKGTLNIYRLRLVHFFSMLKKNCQDITANDIRMYLFYYKSNRNASNSYMDEIRRILNSRYVQLRTYCFAAPHFA